MTRVQIGPHALAQVHGPGFLRDLTAVAPAELRVVDRDERVLADAEDDPPTAPDVAAWWARLDTDERQVLATLAPSVVGNLEGVPYAVRDQANRAVLTAGLADPATPPAQVAMLGQVRESLVAGPGAPTRSLITLDTRGSGRAAIAIGDLDTAADVTVVVPGMFFTVTGQMADFTATANDLYSEQATLAPLAAGVGGVTGAGSGVEEEPRTAAGAASCAAVRTAVGAGPCAGSRAATGPRGTASGIAVVAWMGYRTPDLSNILSLGLAETGATRLERAVDGLREIRGDDQPRLNVVAHSYGSTAALIALSSGRMQADSLTVLGSPGSAVRHASALAVPAGEVFVGGAHSDPIAGSGYFGTDPGSAQFGSTLLDLAGGADAQDAGEVFRRPVGHNDYLKPGTASLHDVALVAIGRGDLVRDPGRHGNGRGEGVPQPSPDMYLVRPQDLQQRD
ncbi:alpha/beta hydrolase [Curtobacterium sp. ISL-83]|uniref:alpha/beta hydrolase n=1 Tax=Curtobacterium sp. ISL-83 TaxID=2819145 RepID=UPI001BE71E54|nr:alpha/beta hydrolase [Curtobacterium sp. ISL-83]MBT2501513.1 hypothetical protein [Curtobacterium sp. ISL-83]